VLQIESVMIDSSFSPEVRSRLIVESDKESVAELLSIGLGYPESYFAEILDRLSQNSPPDDFPKYGYVLTNGSVIVGAILLIFSRIKSDRKEEIRCHVTSWYVEQRYRCYAAVFYSRALKHKHVTYLNISARPAALPIVKLQGFSKYSSGQFAFLPVTQLLWSSFDNEAIVLDADEVPDAKFMLFELEMLRAHASYGCWSFWCVAEGSAHPFIFQPRRFKGFIPGVQLVYCRDVHELVKFVRPISFFLTRRGILVVRLDANGPVPGLIGRYFDGLEPRYYKGPKPRLGDLTYTQTVMCPYTRKARAGKVPQMRLKN